MKYDTWMSETKRGVTTPRSRELQAVDSAFRDCLNTDTAQFTHRKELADKLKLWLEAQDRKGQSWLQSTRNSTRDSAGRGTVERLMRDLSKFQELTPTFQKFLGRAVAPVVVTKAYAPGKWDRSKDVDGHWYDFIRQEKGNSCVCASIAMVKRAFHNLATSSLSEEQVRGLMALEEKGNLNQGISAISHTAQTSHDWENIGTGPVRAVNVLKRQPHPVPGARKLAATSGDAVLNELRKCSRKQPGLIGWRWTNGAGHFTMCCGPTKDGSQLIIVDPWTGIEYVDNTTAGFTSYQGGTGKLGVAIVCA